MTASERYGQMSIVQKRAVDQILKFVQGLVVDDRLEAIDVLREMTVVDMLCEVPYSGKKPIQLKSN